MAEESVMSERWLTATAYVQFQVNGDEESCRLMERDARDLVKSLGMFGFYLMGHAVFPKYGVDSDTAWWDADATRHTDPVFRRMWDKREKFREVGQGVRTLFPRMLARELSRELVGLLILISTSRHSCDGSCLRQAPQADVVCEVLADMRGKFAVHLGEENAAE